MSQGDDEAVLDPIGLITRLVGAVGTGLDPTRLREVVTASGGGRAKRRRLARILSQSPELLTTGGPPVPWAVGELLFDLRAAGAGAIAAPRCGECGRTLTYKISRAGCMICSPCRDQPQPCAACGNLRRVTTRDRRGQPRCDNCPDLDGDPMAALIDLVTAIDPALDDHTITAAVEKATARPAGRRRLAWAVVDNPALLAGNGCDAPAPAVLRFIANLLDAGANGIAAPACARCGQVKALSKTLEGRRVCRNCFAHHAAVPCGRCGVLREPATRDPDGSPVCPNCLTKDPINLEDCDGCGRRTRVAARTPEGTWCQDCRPRPTLTCSICGRSDPCEVSRATGQPWCYRCQRLWARCSGCGTVASVRGGTRAKPLCAHCANPDPDAWARCPTCSITWQSDAAQPCHRCALEQRAHQMLAGPDGRVRPELAPLAEALSSIERPPTAMVWLARPAVAALLTAIATDQRTLTHQVLDELSAGKTLDHMRAVLVAGGMLPARDEHLVKLERWATQLVQSRPEPEERQLLHSYVVWHHLRRLRRRVDTGHTTYLQAHNVRCHATAAAGFLDWLRDQDLTLATCTQPDLERWIGDDDGRYREETSHFIRWSVEHRHARDLTYGTVRWTGPRSTLDGEKRWDDARRLLADDTIPTPDRVAGLLLLLYAQKLSMISRLTPEHVLTDDAGNVRLQMGSSPTALPEPLARLVLDLVATRRPFTVIGHQGTSPWLFPGQRPGQPISATRLGDRLAAHGIKPQPSRSTALFTLATELPAAILARMLDIHIKVAVQWQKASAGDWAAYAADVARRPHGS